VTGVELPADLAGLPAPWNLSSSRARGERLGARGTDAAAARSALTALDRALAAFPGLPDPPEEALPAELADSFDFTAEWLAEAMPTLDDLSAATIATLLERRLPGHEPDPGQVDALAGRWLLYTTADIIRSALNWLETGLRQLGDPALVEELLALVARRLPDQPPGLAATMLTHAARIARGRARPLLATVAGDDKADAGLRDHASSLRTWLSGFPAERTE
jgi:hypothetical protein